MFYLYWFIIRFDFNWFFSLAGVRLLTFVYVFVKPDQVASKVSLTWHELTFDFNYICRLLAIFDSFATRIFSDLKFSAWLKFRIIKLSLFCLCLLKSVLNFLLLFKTSRLRFLTLLWNFSSFLGLLSLRICVFLGWSLKILKAIEVNWCPVVHVK